MFQIRHNKDSHKRLMKAAFSYVCSIIMPLTATTGWALSESGLATAPIVGLMQKDRISISVRGLEPGPVRLEYRHSGSSKTTLSQWQNLDVIDALTTDFVLTRLEPDTEYDYRLEFGNGSRSDWYTFRTFPSQDRPGKFNFVFSACAREREKPHRIFSRIAGLSPTFVVMLGDNMYADYDGDVNDAPLTDIKGIFRDKYQRNFEDHFQKMCSGIPVIAIWDDHDYGQDNSDRNYPHKEIAKDVLQETFPEYPYIVEDGGLYYKFTVADVDFFALDTRWYRSPMQDPDDAEKTMLGAEQLEWLLRELKASQSTFKVVFSSVSLNDYGGDTSSGRSGYDSWMDYRYEREKVMSAVTENRIRGVMFFSGDQHYPSSYLLNWQKPLRAVSKTDTSVVFSLPDLGAAVFDFSASPLHYRRATGKPLLRENQDNPRYSYEIFRVQWGKPEYETPEVVTSVFGLAKIDTENPTKRVSVEFFELVPNTGRLHRLYRIDVTTR